MYKNVSSHVNFPEMEESILAFWESEDIFKKSIRQRSEEKKFVFYDGPPFATGLPHFGHFVPGTIKDIIPRYKTMRGYRVERRFGWDCHGLPVEALIEKELGLNSKSEIEKYGIGNFNEACRNSVLRYVKEWRRIMTRLGRWVDFDNDYKTMDKDYMESIWWVVRRLWDEGLMYEGSYILPYCPRCATVLSNHELALGAYKNIHDPAITVAFLVANSRALSDNILGNVYFLAWTTTPWTLPSNLGLCVGPEIDYVLIVDKTNPRKDGYIIAESRIPHYFTSSESFSIIWKKKGKELVHVEYVPLFSYFASEAANGAFRVLLGAHVTDKDGTGIVHTAPGFGEDDYQVMRSTKVRTICPIDAECRFTQDVPDYKGIFVKEADKLIIERLKSESKLFRREQILHSYPFCWRCDHPLIYRAIGSWFVNINKIKNKMLAANQAIWWVPAHLKDGRFGKWLENARDWAISRNRYWGNPLPIWKCASCNAIKCIGSVEELEGLAHTKVDDLHTHFIDKIGIPCQCGASMTRIPEVLDCWFESGAMPYAQVHYPFKNKTQFENHFPADFISESMDQTRGWFYTLTIIAAAIFNKPAFQNCVVSGLVLAEDGKKMSKSQRNYTDPIRAIEKFGSDALRLYLMNSPILRGEDLMYTDDGVKETIKNVLLPLWNAYSFFVTYANIDGFRGASTTKKHTKNELDRWILSVCEGAILQSKTAYDNYDVQAAITHILSFIDCLNNWYIRRSRRRFWKSTSESDEDKLAGYATLYRVLLRLALLSAPIIPFITEEIWQNLADKSEAASIHLCDWPTYDEAIRDVELEQKMKTVRKAVSLGRALRLAEGVKVRQPLQTLIITTQDQQEKVAIQNSLFYLTEELNVKNIEFCDDESTLIKYKAKANYRQLGKILGKDMNAFAEKIALLDEAEIMQIAKGGSRTVSIGDKNITINSDVIEIIREEKPGYKTINEGTLSLAIDTTISPELREEGIVRDLIRALQNLRKDSGLSLTDRIKLTLAGTPTLEPAIQRFSTLIMEETLATSLIWSLDANSIQISAGDLQWQVVMHKVIE